MKPRVPLQCKQGSPHQAGALVVGQAQARPYRLQTKHGLGF